MRYLTNVTPSEITKARVANAALRSNRDIRYLEWPEPNSFYDYDDTYSRPTDHSIAVFDGDDRDCSDFWKIYNGS